MTGRALPALLAAAAVLLLSGCTADVATGVTVTSAAGAQVTATVTLDGAVADKLNADPKLRDQLVGVLRARLHTDPQVDSGAHRLTLRATTDYAALTGNADVLGVSTATLSGTGHAVTAHLQLADPAALRAAITSGVGAGTDAAAVAATMLASTTVTTTVHFAGGISAVGTSGGLTAARHGDEVVVTRPLAAAPAGGLTVTGDPTAPTRWPLYAAGGVVLAGAGLLLRRRAHARR